MLKLTWRQVLLSPRKGDWRKNRKNWKNSGENGIDDPFAAGRSKKHAQKMIVHGLSLKGMQDCLVALIY